MASIPAPPPKKPEPKYVDLPSIGETFADSIRSIGFDGQTWRIELTVTRLDAELLLKGAKQIEEAQFQYPACRLVLPMQAGLELINKLTQTATAMEAQGLLKKNEPPKKPMMVTPESKGPH